MSSERPWSDRTPDPADTQYPYQGAVVGVGTDNGATPGYGAAADYGASAGVAQAQQHSGNPYDQSYQQQLAYQQQSYQQQANQQQQGYRQYVQYEEQHQSQAQSQPQYPGSEYEDPGYSSYPGTQQQYPQGYPQQGYAQQEYAVQQDYAQEYPQQYGQGYTQEYGQHGQQQAGYYAEYEQQTDPLTSSQYGSYAEGQPQADPYYSGYGYGQDDALSQSQPSSLGQSHSESFVQSLPQPDVSAQPPSQSQPASSPSQPRASQVPQTPEQYSTQGGYSADAWLDPDPELVVEPDPVRPPATAVKSAFRAEPVADDADGGSERANVEGRRQSAPPAPKKRRRRTVGVVAALVIAGASAAYVYSGHSSSDGNTSGASSGPAGSNGAGDGAAGAASASASVSPKATGPTPVAKLILPASVDGLTAMTNTTGKNVVKSMNKANASSPDLSNALVAAFEKSGSSSFFADLTLVQLSKAPDFENIYQGSSPAGALKTLGASGFTDSETISTKIPGSAMACGLSTAGGVILRKCIWVDASEYGLFAAVKSLSNSQAAAYAEAIEAASEGS